MTKKKRIDIVEKSEFELICRNMPTIVEAMFQECERAGFLKVLGTLVDEEILLLIRGPKTIAEGVRYVEAITKFGTSIHNLVVITTPVETKNQ